MKKFYVVLAAMFAVAVCLHAEEAENQVTGTCGEEVTITATPEDGYEFSEWKDGSKENPRTVVISSELQLLEYEAIFVAKTMTVVATANNAAWGHVEGAGSAKVGETMTLKAVEESTCYRFLHWLDDETNTNPERTITVATTDAANTYQAVFEQVEFTVKVKAGAHGSVSISK